MPNFYEQNPNIRHDADGNPLGWVDCCSSITDAEIAELVGESVIDSVERTNMRASVGFYADYRTRQLIVDRFAVWEAARTPLQRARVAAMHRWRIQNAIAAAGESLELPGVVTRPDGTSRPAVFRQRIRPALPALYGMHPSRPQ